LAALACLAAARHTRRHPRDSSTRNRHPPSTNHPHQGDKNAHIQATKVVRTERELHKLFTQLAERYRHREGGYTRVIHAGRRQFDAAPMAYIE
jgi:ribosomal protein L17